MLFIGIYKPLRNLSKLWNYKGSNGDKLHAAGFLTASGK
jgi:hypothetical protein